MFSQNLYGLNFKFKNLIIKRLELTTFAFFYAPTLFFTDYLNVVSKKVIKTLNILFSQVNNVNLTVHDQHKLNILRKYLIKSYQGYCHVLGKPVRGQRTWSNGWNAFKCNNTLRSFINRIKYLQSVSSKNTRNKVDYRSVKKKYTLKPKQNKILQKTAVTNDPIFKSSWY
jgi:ribosomal protein S13